MSPTTNMKNGLKKSAPETPDPIAIVEKTMDAGKIHHSCKKLLTSPMPPAREPYGETPTSRLLIGVLRSRTGFLVAEARPGRGWRLYLSTTLTAVRVST